MQRNFDKATQVILPILTVFGFLLTGMKMPQIGLVISLTSQIFWMYTSWQAWKKAGQIGIFITSIITTVVLFFGVINYWFIR